MLRASRLDSLHAAALVSTGSLILYLPIYLAFHGLRGVGRAIARHCDPDLVPGRLVSIVALFLFGKAIEMLGASAGAAFAALMPPMAALIAIPILGEIPSLVEQAALLAVSLGVYLASGGRLPLRLRHAASLSAEQLRRRRGYPSLRAGCDAPTRRMSGGDHAREIEGSAEGRRRRARGQARRDRPKARSKARRDRCSNR